METGRRTPREAQQAAQQLERDLQDQLTVQSTSLVQAQAEGTALQQQLDEMHKAMLEEKRARELTHGLLAGVLAIKAKPSVKRIRTAKPK